MPHLFRVHETIRVVLCVNTLYATIIVCGNGRSQNEKESLSHNVEPKKVLKDNTYSRFPVGDVDRIMKQEVRARYDIIEFATIKNHANISVDPSTGQMLQTLQII